MFVIYISKTITETIRRQITVSPGHTETSTRATILIPSSLAAGAYLTSGVCAIRLWK